MGLKDTLWMLGYVVTIATIWNSFRNKISKLEDALLTLKSAIYQKTGVLNIIDNKTCEEHRKNVRVDIIRIEEASVKTNEKIDKANEYLLMIIGHLGIGVEAPKKNGK